MKIFRSFAIGGLAMAMLAATPVAAQSSYYGRDRHDNGRNVVIGAAVGALAGAAIASSSNRNRSYGSQAGYYGNQSGYYGNNGYYGNSGYYDRSRGYVYGNGGGYYDRGDYRQDRRAHRQHDRQHRREDRRHERQHDRRW